MFKALGQLWVGLSIFFMAFQKFAEAILSLMTAGSEMAAEFEDEARLERIQKRQAKEQAILEASTPVVAIAAPKKAKAPVTEAIPA